MSEIERGVITRIYKDCLALKRKDKLNEFAQGQLALCKILLKIK